MNIKPTLKKYTPVQMKIENSIFLKNVRILNLILNLYVRFDKISITKGSLLNVFSFY